MRLLPVVLLLAAAAQAAAQEAPNLAREDPPAAKVSVQRAVDEAAAFLVAGQNADGSFGSHTSGRTYEVLASVPGSLQAFRAASTALCWMGLRDAGAGGEAARTAERRALAWLAQHARVKRQNGGELYNVWALAYGLRAVSQALADKAPGAPPGKLRDLARSLVDALRRYQMLDGGWGYYDFDLPTFPPNYTSMSFTTGTVLVALDQARKAGVMVPRSMVERGVRSVRRLRKEDGSYVYGTYLRYRPAMGVNRVKGSLMRTPVCHLALHLHGGHVGAGELVKGLEDLRRHHRFAVAGLRRPVPHESWYQVSGYFYLYGHMYAAMCLEHVPEESAARLWPAVVRGVLKCRQPEGSFWDYPLYGYHRFYGTGYALMALGRCPPEVAASLQPEDS